MKNKRAISISKNPKISLGELFKKYKGKNLTKDFKWDNQKGKEII